jgi:hypothetical protein
VVPNFHPRPNFLALSSPPLAFSASSPTDELLVREVSNAISASARQPSQVSLPSFLPSSLHVLRSEKDPWVLTRLSSFQFSRVHLYSTEKTHVDAVLQSLALSHNQQAALNAYASAGRDEALSLAVGGVVGVLSEEHQPSHEVSRLSSLDDGWMHSRTGGDHVERSIRHSGPGT